MRVLKSFSFENADRVSLVVTEVVVATGVFLERKPSLSPKTIVREKGTSVAADVKGGSGKAVSSLNRIELVDGTTAADGVRVVDDDEE